MTTLYFLKRIYHEKKYFSFYWEKQYGSNGDPTDRINNDHESVDVAMEKYLRKYLPKDEAKPSSRELNNDDQEDSSDEEGQIPNTSSNLKNPSPDKKGKNKGGILKDPKKDLKISSSKEKSMENDVADHREIDFQDESGSSDNSDDNEVPMPDYDENDQENLQIGGNSSDEG